MFDAAKAADAMRPVQKAGWDETVPGAQVFTADEVELQAFPPPPVPGVSASGDHTTLDEPTWQRKRAARKLVAEAGEILSSLAMEQCRLEVALTPREGTNPHPQGAEEIDFLISSDAQQSQLQLFQGMRTRVRLADEPLI